MKSNKAVAVIVAVSLAAAGTSALAFGKMHGKGEHGPRGEMRFEQLDADKDGKLSRAELEAGPAARFASTDANKDGKISAEEISAEGKNRAEKRFGKMLERFDADKDGALSFEEMKGGERHAKMFDKLDADEDGFLSKDEMRKMRKMGKMHRDGHGYDRDKAEK
jgi:Ca2+-binding EF-hand superfamily protein